MVDEEKIRTVIEEDFELEMVPLKISNPMKEKKRKDRLLENISRLGQLVTYGTLAIGGVSIVMGFIKSV